MSSPRPVQFARYARAAILKAVGAGDDFTPQAILTFPILDYDGDFVHPEGGEWVARPVVNLEHGVPVGWGSVEYKSLDVDGVSHRLPVGTTHFYKSRADLGGVDFGRWNLSPADALSVARQTARLVADGVYDGASIEFEPDPARTRVIGKSATRIARRAWDTNAYHFGGYHPFAWAHCQQPVNDHARLLLPAVEKARRLVADGRFPGGERLSPVIAKSLTSRLPARPTAVVGGYAPRTKAMPDAATADDTETTPVDAPADAPADDGYGDDAGMGDDTPPTAKAAYDAVQQVSDAVAALRDVLKRSEHLKGKAKAMAIADNIESELEDLSAVGDMVVADVSGADEPEPDATAESPAEGGDDADDDGADPFEKAFRRHVKPLKRDADGGIVTNSLYKPRRFRLAGPDGLEEVTAPTEPSATLKALFDEGERTAREGERRQRQHARRFR